MFALAAERGVPILIHAGRGLPPIAAGLEKLVDDHPGSQLILAHAGIADLANLAHRFSGKRGVFFDTSVWSAVDLLGLLRLVPPEQVVYASDYPYGGQPGSLLLALRVAQTVGLDERQMRDMFAGNANRIADGEEPLEPSQPQGIETLAQPLAQARIHQYLSMALPLLFTRQQDGFGALGLALNATEEPNGYHREELDQIRELLARGARPLGVHPRHGQRGPAQRDARRRPPDSDRRHCGGDDRMSEIRLTVNGEEHVLDAAVGTSLASVLRDRLGLTGTKIACAEGHCGACTVQVDGVPRLSCITLAHTVDGEVTTIEGLRDHPLVEAFVRTDAVQCGFCTPGQVVSAAALVAANPEPTRDEIKHAMAGNICRCGTYPKIEEAILTWQD